MSAVPAPTAPSTPLDGPAGGAFTLIFTTLPALLRLTCGLAGAAVALTVRTPPVRVPLLVAAVVVLTAWSFWYAAHALRRGFRPALVLGDVALTTATCLLVPHLVAPEVLPGEGSWVAVLASTTVINAQATAPPRWSLPAGLLVTAGYAAGASWAGQGGEARAHAATLLVQAGCAALMTSVMRRRIGRADRAFADYQRLTREAVAARTARQVERQQNRDLHDTVLGTLTMVGLGAVREGSPALRDRCAADLRTLTDPTDQADPATTADPATAADAATAPTTADAARVATTADAVTVPTTADATDGSRADRPTVALDHRLRAVLDRLPDLPVAASLPPCRVPTAVADALAASVRATLSNVVRHAPGARVTLRLTGAPTAVVVEVTDDGPGFDPGTVPAHRYGLRESVRGRTEAVGGRVTVHSRPGSGTRIRLEWPRAG
ncbi:histidine kinase [Micromonospora rosaria]|uniref:Histidine kinase n=1 Tax=Micromonospora rosaria TaxID=47874 RepID=A0A136PNJ2_9ACTN|nr:ATP-binding protein [Micromonospora rosaria]KXK59962.1 histidine kinase [Micromonospora rosaria]